jgi:hypothetical protein
MHRAGPIDIPLEIVELDDEPMSRCCTGIHGKISRRKPTGGESRFQTTTRRMDGTLAKNDSRPLPGNSCFFVAGGARQGIMAIDRTDHLPLFSG